ncbi:MAG TPA: hypothetical protein VGJ44_28425 [Kribbellaceae bacterium]|jgi:hypothetical protein
MLRRVALGTLAAAAVLALAAAVEPAAAEPGQSPAGQLFVPAGEPAFTPVIAPVTGEELKHDGMTMCAPNSSL